MQGANELLVITSVADRPSGGGDPAADRCFRDSAALPQHVDQFASPYRPVAMTNQVDEQVENLRLDVNACAAAPQLPPGVVKFKVGEAEAQFHPLRITTSQE